MARYLRALHRDGSGNLLATTLTKRFAAGIDDVVRLIELLSPLEEQGILVSRSHRRLEQKIEHYSVHRARWYDFGLCRPLSFRCPLSRIACVAGTSWYRSGSRGADLLAFLERNKRSHGLHKLFVLTTRTAHWF